MDNYEVYDFIEQLFDSEIIPITEYNIIKTYLYDSEYLETYYQFHFSEECEPVNLLYKAIKDFKLENKTPVLFKTIISSKRLKAMDKDFN